MNKNFRGLTLIEIVIAMGILSIILTFGSLWQQKIRQTSFSLERNAELIKLILESTKEMALTGEKHSNWGTYFLNNSGKPDNIFIFQGDTFSSSSIYKTFTLSGDIDFNNISSATSVVFQLWSGTISATTTISIKSLTSNKIANINIYPSGKIEIVY